MKVAYRRKVSPSERIWLGLDNASNPFIAQLILEGRGDIAFERLKDATDEASAANPGSRLILKGSLSTCHWVDSGVTPRVRKVNGAAWDGYGPENAPFLREQLPYWGPTCEVLWVEGPIPRLIFRASHGVMDGQGVLIWAEDILRSLRGEKPFGAFSTCTEPDLMNQFTEQRREPYADKCIAPTGKASNAEHTTLWRRLTIPGTVSNLFGKVGWVVAQSAWRYGEGVVRLVVPVDLRRRQPGLRSTANLWTVLYIDVTRDSTPDSINQSLWIQLRKKYDDMGFEGDGSGDRMPLKVIGLLGTMAEKINHGRGLYNASAVISNIGHIDRNAFFTAEFATESAFFLTQRMYNAGCFIAFSGCSGREELTLSVPHALGTGNRFERLFDDISRALIPKSAPECHTADLSSRS